MTPDPMTPEEFTAAIDELGLTQVEAAHRLGVRSGPSRISDWSRGARPIPPYIAAHLRTLLEIERERAGTTHATED